MAKILCGISGIEFNCDHLPIYLSSREYAHPIFFMPQRKLLGLYQKFRHEELNDIDAYLLFLAYLNSTDLIEWRVPAKRTALTASIVAQNFESLVCTVEKINTIANSSAEFSHIAISPDTCDLSNVQYWILGWESTYESFRSGYKAERAKQDLAELEARLEYISRDANRNEVQYATRLASWADKAGNFPRYPISRNGKVIPCNLHWQMVIRKCTSAESIFTISSEDLIDVKEWCETNIDAGSTYSHDLLKFLREGIQKQNDFLGMGDFQFSIVSADTSVEQANRQAIVQNAPVCEPRRIDYPSEFQFLKAKLAWGLAQQHPQLASEQEVQLEPVKMVIIDEAILDNSPDSDDSIDSDDSDDSDLGAF